LPVAVGSISTVVSTELPPDHTAPSRGRQFVGSTMRGWGLEELVCDAELLVSELVTNAILHARSATTLTLRRDATCVRVEVCDDSAAPPRLRSYGPEAVTGRGIFLVDRIAWRWGVTARAVGKCVWFELALGADASVPAGR
jgi:anti-sigma regulatory factor (Ser/Thr protein kinase)